MYNLRLSAEQLEIRETVRDFVAREIKPVALHPDRLQGSDEHFPPEILDKASQMGLRTLALSEESEGSGADHLTSCIVAEELAAGDVGLATTLAQTSMLGHILFDQEMSSGQRERFLPQYLGDDRYHLAYAGQESDTDAGWSYHRPLTAGAGVRAAAVRQHNGDWVMNGVSDFVINAPLAKLIAVQVRTDPEASGMKGMSTLLVPRETPGLSVRERDEAGQNSEGEPLYRWHHGTGGELLFKDCRVAAANLLGAQGKNPSPGRAAAGGIDPQVPALNLGVGRAAFEAAVEYAKLRIQGGRPIIEHEAIGTLLAEIAIKLQVARSIVWQAAWAYDHPDACADLDAADLPLHTIARVFTSDVVHQATLQAAEVFGAMGVMRDMPLQKYVHDALVFVHAESGNSIAKLRIAEAVAGYRRA